MQDVVPPLLVSDAMTSTPLLVALLLATGGPQSGGEAREVREQRKVGIGLAPAVVVMGTDGLVLPIGASVDVVLAGRWAASLAVARFIPSDFTLTHLYAGARRYLLAGALSPYLAADVGMEWYQGDYGEGRRSPFLTGGLGVEWALPSGPVFSADLHVGPQYANNGGSQREWQALTRARVFVGCRLP